MRIAIDINSIPEFYQKYIKLVADREMHDALRTSHEETITFLQSIPSAKYDFRYAPGKWTIREMICHMIDAERIFVYRALSFSRKETKNLPGFDEDAYVPESNASGREWSAILAELTNVRISTIDFFRSCNDEMLARIGTANNVQLSVLALGYIVSGHELHHLNVLRERYFND